MWPSNSFRHLPALVISPASQPASAALPFLSPLQVLLADLASATLLSLQILLPPAQPNTTLAAPLHPSNGCPSQYGTMQAASGYWAKVLLNYLDHPVRGLAPETQVGLSRYSVTIKLCDSYCLSIGDYQVVQ
ncbi:hypothetical protein NDA14_003284 [Ustilago hordei]|nr:hypothetical protein NDA14_003284 [Ustilago hordei]